MTPCKPACPVANALQTGRATWICPTCGKDVSIQFLMLYEVANPNWRDE